LPKSLQHVVTQLIEQERKQEEKLSQTNDSARERKNLLKIIGALTIIYMGKKDVSAVIEDILQYLENHDLESPGLSKSNLHKKISEGLAILNEEHI